MTDTRELVQHTEAINELLARYGVKFGLYKNGTFKEQLFPFDAIPRIIEHDEFEYLENLKVKANCDLEDYISRAMETFGHYNDDEKIFVG